MPLRPLVFRCPAGPERVGRTLRALEAAGVAAEDAGADLAGALARAVGPVWLVRAGAWPAPPGPIPAPPPRPTRPAPPPAPSSRGGPYPPGASTPGGGGGASTSSPGPPPTWRGVW